MDQATGRQVPPLRYWVALVMLAAEVTFLEKASAVTSGGVSGLAIPIGHWLDLRVGTVMLLLKGAILVAVLYGGSRNLALWTGVASLASSALIWLFEQLPWQPALPPLVAAPLVLIGAGSSVALLWNAGYSSGGYAAIAQILHLKKGIPHARSMLMMNAFGLVLMYLAFGIWSGLVSVVTTLCYGMVCAWWLKLWNWLLPPLPAAVPAGVTPVVAE